MSNYVKTMFPQASISTRSDTAVTKPAVFHSETKRKMQLEIQNKRKNGRPKKIYYDPKFMDGLRPISYIIGNFRSSSKLRLNTNFGCVVVFHSLEIV